MKIINTVTLAEWKLNESTNQIEFFDYGAVESMASIDLSIMRQIVEETKDHVIPAKVRKTTITYIPPGD